MQISSAGWSAAAAYFTRRQAERNAAQTSAAQAPAQTAPAPAAVQPTGPTSVSSTPTPTAPSPEVVPPVVSPARSAEPITSPAPAKMPVQLAPATPNGSEPSAKPKPVAAVLAEAVPAVLPRAVSAATAAAVPVVASVGQGSANTLRPVEGASSLRQAYAEAVVASEPAASRSLIAPATREEAVPQDAASTDAAQRSRAEIIAQAAYATVAGAGGNGDVMALIRAA